MPTHGHRLDNLRAERVNATLTVTGLAKKSNTSDHTIVMLENGGACEPYEAQRIADALGVSLVTLGKKDL